MQDFIIGILAGAFLTGAAWLHWLRGKYVMTETQHQQLIEKFHREH